MSLIIIVHCFVLRLACVNIIRDLPAMAGLSSAHLAAQHFFRFLDTTIFLQYLEKVHNFTLTKEKCSKLQYMKQAS